MEKAINEIITDIDDIVQGEFDENELRKDFTPSERVAIIEELLPKEEDEAEERQGARTDLEHSEKFTECSKGFFGLPMRI